MKSTMKFIVLTASFLISSNVFAQSWQQDCKRCGRITKIEKVHDGKSGIGGAVIGGIAGGLLGNQVGSGDGKKVATVAGVAGGAYAGKEIAERNMEYKIQVKMQDGRYETVRQELIHNLRVGDIVRVKDGKAKIYKP
jgi:outer membrane lipoprotein SlyB